MSGPVARIFSGLRSRWKNPRRCMYAKPCNIKKDDKSKIGEREGEGKQLKNLGCAVSKRLHFEDQSEKAIWPLVHRSRNNKENYSIIKEEISCQTKKYDTSLGPLGKYYNCSYSSDYTFRRKYQNTDSQNTQTSPTLRSILGTPW